MRLTRTSSSSPPPSITCRRRSAPACRIAVSPAASGGSPESSAKRASPGEQVHGPGRCQVRQRSPSARPAADATIPPAIAIAPPHQVEIVRGAVDQFAGDDALAGEAQLVVRRLAARALRHRRSAGAGRCPTAARVRDRCRETTRTARRVRSRRSTAASPSRLPSGAL